MEAIFRTMRRQDPPEKRNSVEDLVFVFALVVGGKERVLRILNDPDIDFDGSAESKDGVLELTWHLVEPVPTKHVFVPENSDDDYSHRSDVDGVARVFAGDDVADDDTLDMSITVYDKTTKKFATAYLGAVQWRVLPYDHHYDYDRCGFDFRPVAIDVPSPHIHNQVHYKHYGLSDKATGSLYFNAEKFRRDVVPSDELDTELELDRFKQWHIPVGTNFTTLQLSLHNVDDITHLKALRRWTRPSSMV